MEADSDLGTLPPADDEGELVTLARAGDRRALEALVQANYGVLRALLLRSACVPAADLDDVIQETFLRAFAALDRYEHRGHLRTWLFRIALNFARDLRRRAGRAVTEAGVLDLADLPDFGADPARVLAERLDGERLGAAVARLPEGHREVLVLRFYGGQSLEEVARTMGCPVGTVKSRLHYALRKLRGILGEREAGERGREEAGPAGGRPGGRPGSQRG